MRYSQLATTTFLLVILFVTGQAQTPAAAQKYFQQGVKSLAEGNLEVAFENYSRAIEISSRLDNRKPSTRLRANNLTSSDDTSNIAVVDPFTAIAYTSRGIVRCKQHDYDGAIADFNAALRISPRLPSAYIGRAVASRVRGEFDKARADIERAISINGELAEAYTNRADLKLEAGDLEGAAQDLDRALKLNPRVAETYYMLEFLNMNRKRYEKPVANSDQATRLRPDMAGAYHGRGTARMSFGRFDDA